MGWICGTYYSDDRTVQEQSETSRNETSLKT
jgi:hypothetical protein